MRKEPGTCSPTPAAPAGPGSGAPARPAAPSQVRPLWAGGVWCLAAFVLYTATGAWDLVWGDASKLTLYAMSGYFPSLNPGDHAGWTAVAWALIHLLPVDPVVVAHRLSGLGGALAVGGVATYSLLRGAGATVAHTRATVLLLAHAIWWAAGAAESYAPALAAAMIGGCIAAAGRRGWRWLPAGLVWGLAIAMHAWTVFLVVPIGWEVGRRQVWRALPTAVLGLAPVWLAAWSAPSDPLTGFAASSVTTWSWHWNAFLAAARVPANTVLLSVLVLYSLGPLGLEALRRGLRERWESWHWWPSLVMLTVLLLLYVPYRLHVMAGFLVTALVLAVPARLPPLARCGHAAVQVAAYAAAPALLVAMGHGHLGVRVLPFRNNAVYFLNPTRGLDAGATKYVSAVAGCAPPVAVVLGDFNAGSVLRLAQECRDFRADLEIRPVVVDVALGSGDPVAALVGAVEEARGRGPVVLADTYQPYYRVSELESHFYLSRCGPVVVVGPARSGEGDGAD